MRVMVLGHRGMLGHVVARWLGAKHEVLTTNARYSGAPQDELIAAVAASNAAWIVNCIAKIDQKSASPAELHLANAILPLHLKLSLAPQQKLIHASTDGVFSGRRGEYKSDEPPDPVDLYGLSKALGEAVAELNRCYVIRTSIIGPAAQGSKGLLSWLLNAQGQVNGFTNHRWNGLTTLEWAKLCEEMISGELQPPGALFHAGSASSVSKFDLLKLIAETWDLKVEVRPAEAPSSCDRTLVMGVQRAEIREQLRQMRDWL